MNQLEVFAEQQRVMRGFWEGERVRAKREAEAEEKRQADSRTAEQNAATARDKAAKTLQAIHSEREAIRNDLQKVNLPDLIDQKTVRATSDARPENIRATQENTVAPLRRQISELVTALLRWHHEEGRRVERYGVEIVICPSCSTMNSLAFSRCIKCSSDLGRGKVITNPYL